MARRAALRRSRLRASEADRDRVAERLRHATVEGRLQAAELDERLGVALSARTYGELEPLVADLPGASAGPLSDATVPLRVCAALVLTILLVALGAVAWHRW
jgi:hypothetical protein